MEITEMELYRSLRAERRWAIAERGALWIVGICVGLLMIGLVCAATIVAMDAAVAPPPFHVMDHQWPA